MNMIECDVCVIGCGSGGIGAAVGAAEYGASVVVVDKNHVPGGVVSMSWVHNWEPVCGNGPLSRRLWRRMRSYPLGAAEMEFTVSRCGTDDKRNPTMPFEAWAYQHAVYGEFAAHERLRFFAGMRVDACLSDGRRIRGVVCRGAGVEMEIRAKCFVDASGDASLARMARCPHMLGEDGREEYDEFLAPEKPLLGFLNEVNWIYRVRNTDRPSEPLVFECMPERARVGEFFKAEMPNGDWLINICGKGRFNPENIDDYCRVKAEQYDIALKSFYHLSSEGGRDWQLTGMAPEMGIRESYRVAARKVMTLNDVLSFGKSYEKSFIGMTDHPLDLHGSDIHRLGSIPYGIAYESMLTREYDNLFLAGRGIGVSHIVASSCRISRTLMTCGNAIGRAAAICAVKGIMPEDVNIGEIAEFESCPDFVYANAAARIAQITEAAC